MEPPQSSQQMLEIEGHLLAGTPQPSTTSTNSQPDHQVVELGTPSKQRPVSRNHYRALYSSLISLIVGVLVITPTSPTAKFNLPWILGFGNQIIIIGLVLSVMDICTGVVLFSAFLQYEARFGRSRLQNYQAILTKSFIESKVGKRWRFLILLTFLLPLGLSVAYKKCLGGTASFAFHPTDSPRTYGLDFPRIGDWAPSALNSIYLLLTAITPFWTAAKQGNVTLPEAREYPLAYGYNTLLLDRDAAAVLDIPTTSYIATLQGQLAAGESFNISADVDAYVATRDDQLTISLATNDSLWRQSMNKSDISTIELYKGFGAKLGILPCGNNDRMLIGLYYDSDPDLFGGIHFHGNETDPEALRFRQRAHVYSMRRARCHGAWQLNSTGIFLTSGFCNSTVAVDQQILQEPNMEPFPFDLLPPLLQTFKTLVRNNQIADAPWLSSAYAMSVATVYWSRGLYVSQDEKPFTPYDPIGEALVSTRSTLRASWLLYVVLAIHPMLTVMAFVAVAGPLRKVPVGPDFSFVAMMSGLERDGLRLLRGAAFSGELQGPVRVGVVDEVLERRVDGSAKRARIRYHLSREPEDGRRGTDRRAVLRGGCKYE